MEPNDVDITQMGHVAPGKLLLEVTLEGEMVGQIIKPDSTRRYHPLARIVQVGEDLSFDWAPGRWVIVSQYAGQLIGKREEGRTEKGFLICQPLDILALMEESDEVAAQCAAAVA